MLMRIVRRKFTNKLFLWMLIQNKYITHTTQITSLLILHIFHATFTYVYVCSISLTNVFDLYESLVFFNFYKKKHLQYMGMIKIRIGDFRRIGRIGDYRF